MTKDFAPTTITRLEKVAIDNGFDQQSPHQGDWLVFSSTQAPLRVWLSAVGDSEFAAAFSQLNVARALGEHGMLTLPALPTGAVAGRSVTDIPALHQLVRRAFQLSKTLPDELLHTFEKQTAALPKSTEAERLIVQRVGQDLFRQGLLEYWEGRCAITGLAIPELLRASHIKPWADCASDAERLDVFNGLLLAPNLDAAFDRGFITFADNGVVIVADVLTDGDRVVLGLDGPLSLNSLTDGHRTYLRWHTEHVYKRELRRTAVSHG